MYLGSVFHNISFKLFVYLLIHFLHFRNQDRIIYNYTSSEDLNITYEEIFNMGMKLTREEIPFNGVLWYPRVTIIDDTILAQFLMLLFHWIPAIILDKLAILVGQPPQ